jgi:hypothetical protein
MPVILATSEAEIRRIMVQSQRGQIVRKTLSQKTLHKKRASGVAQGEGPEFKPQYCKNKTKQKSYISFCLKLSRQYSNLSSHLMIIFFKKFFLGYCGLNTGPCAC